MKVKNWNQKLFYFFSKKNKNIKTCAKEKWNIIEMKMEGIMWLCNIECLYKLYWKYFNASFSNFVLFCDVVSTYYLQFIAWDHNRVHNSFAIPIWLLCVEFNRVSFRKFIIITNLTSFSSSFLLYLFRVGLYASMNYWILKMKISMTHNTRQIDFLLLFYIKI